ncbi:MAG: hypothetical protein QXN16_02995 [Candidatus Micrarchaeaceae archaeon]
MKTQKKRNRNYWKKKYEDAIRWRIAEERAYADYTYLAQQFNDIFEFFGIETNRCKKR